MCGCWYYYILQNTVIALVVVDHHHYRGALRACVNGSLDFVRQLKSVSDFHERRFTV